MNAVGQPERATQNRIITLFRDELGYRYLGDRTDRDRNSKIEDGLLSAWLTHRGYSAAQISIALHKFRTEADSHNNLTNPGATPARADRVAMMDRAMPQWRFYREQLNRLPVRHEEWAY